MSVRTCMFATVAAMLLMVGSPLLVRAEPEEGFEPVQRAPEITGQDVIESP